MPPSHFGLSVEPGIVPAVSVARDRALLAVSPADSSGMLRLYSLAHDVVVLGRYQRRPSGHGVALTRRCTGGRVVPGGDGLVGVSLVLPHRAALVGDDPRLLAPEQVLNRCVRGVLEGLRALGVDAFYPGRDLVTAGGRTLGVLGLEVVPGGATFFEATVAIGRDLCMLPPLLDRADPEGVVGARMWVAEEVTCVAAIAGRTPLLDEVAHVVAGAYHELFGVHFEALEGPLAQGPADASWLDGRALRAELDRHARTSTMLGFVEAHAHLDASGKLAALQLAGDFLASSAAVDRLEASLVGCEPLPGAVHARVTAAFSGPDDFLLGVEAPTLTETIVRAVT